MTDDAASSRFTTAIVWLFGQVRPALHNVLWVIYVGLSAMAVAAARVAVKHCFFRSFGGYPCKVTSA